MTKMAVFTNVQHFAYVKEPVVEKYAKPKIFMPATSKKCQIFLIWQH